MPTEYSFDVVSKIELPEVSNAVQQQLAVARSKDDDAAIDRILTAAGLKEPVVQSGTVTVRNGVFLNPDAQEAPAPGLAKSAESTTSANALIPRARTLRRCEGLRVEYAAPAANRPRFSTSATAAPGTRRAASTAAMVPE